MLVLRPTSVRGSPRRARHRSVSPAARAGPELLLTPEPNFFILGSKVRRRASPTTQTPHAPPPIHEAALRASEDTQLALRTAAACRRRSMTAMPVAPAQAYGRASSFLLTHGHEHVKAVVDMLKAGQA